MVNMDFVVVLLLIVLNGLFAMAEIAIISARKSNLQKKAKEGDKNAKAALELAESPSRFLSTVQIGITFIGIFAGAFGGKTLAKNLAQLLQQNSFLAPYSQGLALVLVVSLITYLSLVIGELVPKRLALTNPENFARFVAKPMKFISFITSPLVSFLSFSTDGLLKLLKVKTDGKPSISEEEVQMLIKEGAKMGVFQLEEKDILERAMLLNDKQVNVLMTPRKDIVWLDTNSHFKTIKSKIIKTPYSYFPVCRDNIDKVLGIVRTKDLLTHFLVKEKVNLKNHLRKPLFIPESMDGLKVLEAFRKSKVRISLVIDEYGHIQGLLSLTDILEALVGNIPTTDEPEEKDIIKRSDNSFLVDGMVSTDRFKDFFKIKKIPEEKTGAFNTIGGFVMHKLSRVPVSGDKFKSQGFRFEVVDMDNNRVDKVLVTPLDLKNKKRS
jgi:putative hemolysin